MLKTAHKLRGKITDVTKHVVKSVKSLKSLKHPKHRRKLMVAIKYKIFLFDRRWQLHPVLGRTYPKPGMPRRIAIGLTAFLIVGAGFMVYMHNQAQADWYNTTWLYRKAITINHNQVPSTQTNFPVLIKTTDPSLAANAQVNANDIVFTSSDGTTKLPHEIESYATASGTLTAWVNVPSLSSTADTIIYMYYGNPAAANQQNPSAVWDGNYKSVYHLDEVGNGTGGEYKDSTTTANNGQGGNGTPANVPTKVTGAIGDAQSFDGSNDVITTPSTTLFDATSTYTLEAWIKPNSCGEGGNGEFFTKVGTIGWYLCQTGNNLGLIYGANGTTGESNAGSISLNTWQHVVVTHSSGTLKFYVNGVNVTNDATVTDANAAGQFELGSDDPTSGSFHYSGLMDEARVSNSVRSADWIATEYNNESAPSTFETFGNQQQKKNPVLYWNFDEGGGTSANDSSGSSLTGTISNATWQNKDVCLFEGKCLKFNGTTSKVSRAYTNLTGDAWCNDTNGLHGCTASWSARMKITFSGNQATTPLSSFPVLVKLDSTRINYAQTQAGGRDIRFVDAGSPNTVIPYEIESWNSGGTSYVWVQVPAIAASSTTDYIYMYYGNSLVPTDGQQQTSVWSNNYSLVQHLNDAACGTAIFKDSSSNNFTGTCHGSGPTSAAGQISNGRTFNGSTHYISVPYSSAFNPGSNPFSVSFWVNPTAIAANAAIMQHIAADDFTGWEVYLNSGGCSAGTGRICFWDGTTDVNIAGGITANTWQQVTVVKSGTTVTAYLNGNSVGSQAVAATIPAVTALDNSPEDIGADPLAGGTSLSGGLDEMRYSSTNRSSDWIKADYLTQTDALNTYGSAEAYAAPMDGSKLDPGTGSFSVGTWFRHPAGGSGLQTLISRVDGNTVNGVGYKLNYDASATKLCFGIDDTAGTFATSDAACTNASVSYADNQWHYVEGVKNGTSSITLYVDGKQVATDASLASTGSLSGSSPTFYVGMDADGTSNPWNGYIDEVRVYDYARSTSEIQADYLAKGAVLGLSTSVGITDPRSSLNQGLVGYWKLDDGINIPCASGVNKACDSSGNGTVGTWTNGTASTSGKFANAAKFDGVNDYIDFGSASTMQNPTTAITVSAWVNIATHKNWNNIVLRDSWTNPGSVSWNMYADGAGTANFGVSDTTGTENTATSQPLSTNTWYHLVGTYDGINVKLYLNGTLVSTVFKPGLTFSPLTGLHISDTTNTMNGRIDDVRIYNRALGPSEITNLYDWAPGPVGWWKLDEGSGTSANDSSSNGYTGTLTNLPQWVGGKYGKALSFDGLSNFVTAGNVLDMPNTSSMTLQGWVNVKSYPTAGNLAGYIVSKYNSGVSGEYYLSVNNDGTASFVRNCGAAGGVQSNTVLAKNTWYFVSGTYDGSNYNIYINGVLDKTVAETASCPSTSDNVVIGAGAGSKKFLAASIDDVRIYNYARTPKQIVSDLNDGHPAVGSPVGSPMINLKFNDGYGNVASNSGNCGLTCDANLFNLANPATSASGWTKNGKNAGALSFDGINDYARIPSSTANTLSAPITMSTWINTRSFPGNGNNTTFMEFNAGSWFFELKDTSAIDCGYNGAPELDVNNANLKKNTWYYVTCTYDDTSGFLKLYINGKLYNSESTGGVTAPNFGSFWDIGRAGWDGQYFNGMMDDVKVYNYALNQNEIYVDMNQGKSLVLGGLGTNPDGTASNSAARAFCPPGDSGSNCAGTGVLNPAPVGYWPFNEHTGLNAQDMSGTGNNGTLGDSGHAITARPTWSFGKIGSALNFNDQWIDVPTSSSLNFGGNITVSAWIYPTKYNTGGNYDTIAGWTGGQPGDYFYQLKSGSHVLVFNITGSSGGNLEYAGNTAVPLNQWTHVEAVYDQTNQNIKLYLNGKLDATDPFLGVTRPVDIGNPDFIIGSYTTGIISEMFHGNIDDVKLYNYVRTPAQVAWDYNRDKPAAWYRFDDCNGTVLHDSSGNGNNGTITIATGTQTSAGSCNSGSASEAWSNGIQGKINSSLNFDGNGDFVTVPAFSPLATVGQTTTNVSWGGWFFPTSSAANETLMEKATEFRITTDASSRPTCSIYSSGFKDAAPIPASVPLNSWNHIMCSYDGTNIYSFVNGKLVSVTAKSNAITAASSILYIAENSSSAQQYSGKIDDVRIYPYALNSVQIKTLLNGDAAVLFAPITGRP